MSSVISQLVNTATHALHKATYNPEAEKYAKELAEKAEREKAAKEAEVKRAADLAKKIEKENLAKQERDKLAAEQEARGKFDLGRLTGNALGTALNIVLILVLVGLGTFGASLATNLNLYKPTTYRVLYAIYGFFFFFVVIPYCIGYRWWWNGHQPRFYALIPLVPYKFENRWMGIFFSWLSYKPDDEIEQLKEWLYVNTQ